MTFRKAVLSLAVLLIATVPLALAQGTYTQIDVPGGFPSVALGINNAGDLVGSYSGHNGKVDGFLFSGGVYTSIDYPGAQFTYLSGINAAGQIAGYYAGSNFIYSGFLYDVSTQAFTPISYPAAIETIVTGINDTGAIVGVAKLSATMRVGFELIGSTYKQIVLGDDRIYDLAVSANGLIAGTGQSRGSTSYANFLFDRGEFEPLAIPLPFAQVLGISPDGTALVGDYTPSIIVGFLYQEKILTKLKFPGGQQTWPYCVNDSGVVVGWFFNPDGIQHGFTWTPPADAAKK